MANLVIGSKEVYDAVRDQARTGGQLQRRAVAGFFGLAAGTGWHR